ncbi:MAG: hypothetical protein FJW20_21520 [Acidimicrobiia bacterium]|nr:hypothetical protein [Acidimicrobiia bacterium]
MRSHKVAGWMMGLLMALPAAAQFGGFGGPSVLSRGSGMPGRSAGRPIRFRPYVGISGFYQSGSDAFFRDGVVGNYGSMANFGLVGNSTGKRDFGAVSYSGNHLVAGSNALNTTNHSVNATYGRQVNSRWTTFVGAGASLTDLLSFNMQTPVSDVPSAQLVNPSLQLFDTRAYQFSSAGGLSYQKSARTSFSVSGGAFTMQFREPGFVDTNAYSSQGSVFYLLNRREGIGATYSFTIFDFRKEFGDGQIHNWSVGYQRALSARWSLSASGGVYRLESNRLAQVAVDPLIAALTGQTTVVEALHSINQGVSSEVSIQGRFRRSGIGLQYSRGIMPGNGVFLTARQDTVQGHYSYTGLRTWNLGLFASYAKFSAMTQDLAPFKSSNAGFGASRRLTSILHFTANAGFITSDISRSVTHMGFRNDRYIATVGFQLSPGEFPLSLF